MRRCSVAPRLPLVLSRRRAEPKTTRARACTACTAANQTDASVEADGKEDMTPRTQGESQAQQMSNKRDKADADRCCNNWACNSSRYPTSTARETLSMPTDIRIFKTTGRSRHSIRQDVSKAGITFENFEAGERLASSFENNKDRSFYSSHWPLLLLRHIIMLSET